MNRFFGVLLHWLPIGATTVVLSGFLYAAVQQSYRSSLNDPQIQMAEDAEAALARGRQPADVVPRRELFDAEKSLAPFIAVYDKDGTPLEASASIGNLPPQPPFGVFETAKRFGENRVTWQPNPTTRIALVVRSVANDSGWFVAAGRNMREGEDREARLTAMLWLALVVGLSASFVLDCIGDVWRRRIGQASQAKDKS